MTAEKRGHASSLARTICRRCHSAAAERGAWCLVCATAACDQCGEPFRRRRAVQRFCSSACRYAWHKAEHPRILMSRQDAEALRVAHRILGEILGRL